MMPLNWSVTDRHLSECFTLETPRQTYWALPVDWTHSNELQCAAVFDTCVEDSTAACAAANEATESLQEEEEGEEELEEKKEEEKEKQELEEKKESLNATYDGLILLGVYDK